MTVATLVSMFGLHSWLFLRVVWLPHLGFDLSHGRVLSSNWFVNHTISLGPRAPEDQQHAPEGDSSTRRILVNGNSHLNPSLISNIRSAFPPNRFLGRREHG